MKCHHIVQRYTNTCIYTWLGSTMEWEGKGEKVSEKGKKGSKKEKVEGVKRMEAKVEGQKWLYRNRWGQP